MKPVLNVVTARVTTIEIKRTSLFDFFSHHFYPLGATIFSRQALFTNYSLFAQEHNVKKTRHQTEKIKSAFGPDQPGQPKENKASETFH